MQDTEQEASTAAASVAAPLARRVERDTAPARDLERLRWFLRAAGAGLGALAAGIVFAAHAAGLGWEFYPVSILVFAFLVLAAIGLAAHSRKTHVETERRFRARLFIRNLELQDMAMRDELTQLFNRRFFFERLRRELDQARALQSPLAILVLDVDGLKGINDEFGHQVGDVVLASLGRVVVKCTRTSDIPARLGGDEFGVIMPETDKDGAFAVAKRLERALDAAPLYEGNGASLKLRVSLGVSGFPWGGDSVDEVVQWADTHVYAAKTAHKNEAGAAASSRRSEE